MAALTSWYDSVLPDAPGVLQAFALQKIRDAAIEFCERTCIWIVDHAAIDALANVGAYAYAPSVGTKVVKPMRVWYDTKELEPKNDSALCDQYRYWPGESGTPLFHLGEQSDRLILVPKPAAALAGAIALKVALKPAANATDIADWIFEDYRPAIAAGALAKLKVIPGKPYSDPQGAAYNLSIFEDAIGKAKERALKGLGRARQRVRAQFV